jgi:hypothetical protein
VGFTKVGDGEKCSKRIAAHPSIIHEGKDGSCRQPLGPCKPEKPMQDLYFS